MRAIAAALAVVALSCGGDKSVATPSAPTSPLAAPTPTPPTSTGGCSRTSIGATPLNDLRGDYKGEPGGLYPGGTNTPPPSHLFAGVTRARSIVPLDANGNPSATGRYVFVSIGMSNTTQEFQTFKPRADADPAKDPRLTIVDGAQGSMTADQWASPGCPCWATVDLRLAAARVTPNQVVVAWIKVANAEPTQPFPLHAQILRDNMIAIVRNLKARYPNVQLAYLSSRIYAGYATTTLNPEPYAYESAFAVRHVIATQLSGSSGLSLDAPWLGWGPYLWADGMRPRSDGLIWACSDLGPDGTHPSEAGREKVADLLLRFVKSDPTARVWFVGS